MVYSAQGPVHSRTAITIIAVHVIHGHPVYFLIKWNRRKNICGDRGEGMGEQGRGWSGRSRVYREVASKRTEMV